MTRSPRRPNLSAQSQDILAFVAGHPEGVSALQVATRFGAGAYTYLGRLAAAGHLDSPARGLYRPRRESPHARPGLSARGDGDVLALEAP